MTGEMEALKLGISVFEQIITNPSLMDIMISGKEKDQTARVGVIVRSIVNQPEAQKVFLKKIIETLSQEGESDQTDRRDAVLGVLMTPVIVDILPGNQIVIFDGYLEALGCQTKDNDPYSGSVQSLLDAGIFLAPYFPQDELSKTQLRNLLEQMAQQFSFPGERRHILAFVEDILENATVLGSRDARVKYWKLRKLKEKEIADKLDIGVPMVEQSVTRLIEDGELKSKVEASQERDERVLVFMEQGLTTKEMVDALDETESKITASRMRLYEQERMDPDTWKEKILARKGRAKGGSPQRRKINKPSQEEKQPQAAEHDEEENTIKNYVLDASSKESDEDKDHISVDELVGDAGQTADLTVAEVEKTMHSDIKRTRNDRESHERLFNTKIRALKLIGFGNDEIADLYHIKPWKVLRAVQQLEKNGEIRKFYPGREEGKRLRNIERKSRPLSEAGLDATQIAEKTGEDVEEVQQALMRLSIRAGARKKRG